MRRSVPLLYSVVALTIVILGYAGLTMVNEPAGAPCGTGGPVRVVAAENFWGSLVSQLGGAHAQVISIVSDPNADPHEYETSVADAQALSSACLVVVNGAGYDTWALRVLSAQNSSHRIVLNVQTLLKLPLDVNPHFWYSPFYVNDTVRAMYEELARIDPGDAPYFRANYESLNRSLGTATPESVGSRILEIARAYAGSPVGATEDVFAYLANATRLDLVSPPQFMQAVAEGNEPPTPSVASFEEQVQNGSIKILVYNLQTVTQLTTSMQALASGKGIPLVGITETVQPPDATFQTWMEGELGAIQAALGGAGG